MAGDLKVTDYVMRNVFWIGYIPGSLSQCWTIL